MDALKFSFILIIGTVALIIIYVLLYPKSPYNVFAEIFGVS